MRQLVTFILFILVFITCVNCQNINKLTNRTIVKMVHASLSDELIIYEISNSEVDFILSADSIQLLKSMKVSNTVLETMKKVHAEQHSQVVNEVVDSIPHVNPSIAKYELKNENIAVGYVMHIKGLVDFFANQSENYSAIVIEWNRQMTDSLTQIDLLNKDIQMLELELSNLKNVDSKVFSDNIISLKSQLYADRSRFVKLKMNAHLYGLQIAKQLENLCKIDIRITAEKLNEISKQIKNSNFTPDANNQTVTINYPVKAIYLETLNYISPTTTLIYWYNNMGISLQEIVNVWNTKVEQIFEQDEVLKEHLNQTMNEIETYRKDSKRYQDKISALKKINTNIQKQRKGLTMQMRADSNELLSYLKQMRLNSQTILKQRYDDIIENINFMYNAKLNI